MEMSWSRWFRCESSFGLLLVPNQPGVYALAEEVEGQPAGQQTRHTLAVFDVNETPDLARALSRLFATGSPWRQKLSESRCYVRYAVAGDVSERQAAAGALRHWMNTRRESAAEIFGFMSEHQPQRTLLKEAPATCVSNLELEADSELKTVAERAVDRVTRATEYAGVFPASI